MARQAQTSTAVLGALAIGPLTGYEIRQAITTVLGHFWHESFGQIYPCLVDLEASGLITASPGERAGSRRFEITDAGRARLRSLLSEPPTPQAPRNGVLLRVFLGRELPEGALERLLADVVADARARLATYAAIRASIADDPQYPTHGRFWEATIRAGELSAQATLDWAAEVTPVLTASADAAPAAS